MSPLIVELETVACLVCGSKRQKKLFEAPSDPVEEFGYFGVVQCQECGLVYTNPRPVRSEIHRFYGYEYYGPQHKRFVKPLEWVEVQFRRYRIKSILRFLQSRPAAGGRGGTHRILDVGCGRGEILKSMRELGWEVYGTELSAEAANLARQNVGATIFVGEVVDQHFPDQFFDCITLWHVYEHMYDPRGMLAEIARIIKSGGLLVIGVHNYGSRMARFGGRHWFNFDVPRHTVHFTLPQLQRLLAGYGFRSVHTSHLSWEFDPYCWLQTIYNRLGFEHNLLYTIIRRRDWWQKFSWRKLTKVTGVFVLLPVLVPPAVALAIFDGLGRCNGTFVDYSIRTKE